MSDRPFGFDTLTIPAVLIKDGDPQAAEAAARVLGFGAVRVPAVLVPEGGAPPGGGYVKLGVMEQPVPTPARAPDAAGDRAPNRPDPDPAPQRFRRGVRDGQPPAPASTEDPVAAGIRSWRGLRARRRSSELP